MKTCNNCRKEKEMAVDKMPLVSDHMITLCAECLEECQHDYTEAIAWREETNEQIATIECQLCAVRWEQEYPLGPPRLDIDPSKLNTIKIIGVKPGMMFSQVKLKCSCTGHEFVRTISGSQKIECPKCKSEDYVSFNQGAMLNQMMDCG